VHLDTLQHHAAHGVGRRGQAADAHRDKLANRYGNAHDYTNANAHPYAHAHAHELANAH
jgi:hypothetical protein